MATIVVIAALDTKGEEARLVRDYVAARGHTPVVVDTGVVGEPRFPPDVPAGEVAGAGGTTLEALRQRADRGAAIAAMAEGAPAVARRLRQEGRLDGIVGLGGSAGTAVASAAMRALPVGVPKVLVSTVASGNVAPYVGTRDLALIYSVVDVSGINRLSRAVLTNAAGAVCGATEAALALAAQPAGDEQPLLAASMFGNTTALVDAGRAILEGQGYEVLVFHATGSGGQTMEGLIRDGFVQGAYDVTTTEWADELCGGVFAAGPTRLDAAGERGIPQVLAPGCLDMVNFGPQDTVPATYKDDPEPALLRLESVCDPDAHHAGGERPPGPDHRREGQRGAGPGAGVPPPAGGLHPGQRHRRGAPALLVAGGRPGPLRRPQAPPPEGHPAPRAGLQRQRRPLRPGHRRGPPGDAEAR